MNEGDVESLGMRMLYIACCPFQTFHVYSAKVTNCSLTAPRRPLFANAHSSPSGTLYKCSKRYPNFANIFVVHFLRTVYGNQSYISSWRHYGMYKRRHGQLQGQPVVCAHCSRANGTLGFASRREIVSGSIIIISYLGAVGTKKLGSPCNKKREL